MSETLETLLLEYGKRSLPTQRAIAAYDTFILLVLPVFMRPIRTYVSFVVVIFLLHCRVFLPALWAAVCATPLRARFTGITIPHKYKPLLGRLRLSFGP